LTALSVFATRQDRLEALASLKDDKTGLGRRFHLKFFLETLRAVPIQIPNRKKKQTSHSGVLCRISFIPNHFNRNRNRNRCVPITFEFVTICDICDHNVTKSVLLKKKKNRECELGHKFKTVTFCDRHKCHTLSVTGTKPVSVSVWNPDRNGSHLRVVDGSHLQVVESWAVMSSFDES